MHVPKQVLSVVKDRRTWEWSKETQDFLKHQMKNDYLAR